MATSPLQQTAAVFDESVLKVEFLQMPAQIPDFSLNLNTEALLYRFGLFMQNIIGPARISGFNLSAGATTIGVSPGLYLHQNFIVRLASGINIDGSAVGDGVLYVHIAITRMSGDTNPDIVNINPPLSPASLEGPAQYRYTSGIEVAATLPVSTVTDVYFKVANFHYSGPGFSFTNQNPIISKLGSIDLSQIPLIPYKANSTDVTTQINNAINALVNASPSQLNTLKELADALGDDANFAATVTAALAGKTTPADIPALVRSTVLTGFSLLSNAAATATDSVLSAIGKLQAQINTIASSISSFVSNFGATSAVTFGSVSGSNIVQVLFDGSQVATQGLGDVVAAWPVWQAMDNNAEQKICGSFLMRTGVKNIVLHANCKVSISDDTAYPQLWTDGSGNYYNASPPGVQSTDYVGVIIATPIDDFALNTLHDWSVSVHTGNGGTGFLKDVVVTLES
jgi:hypothetical protein